MIQQFMLFSNNLNCFKRYSQDMLTLRARWIPIFGCDARFSVSCLSRQTGPDWSLSVLGSEGRPGQKRDEWILRHSAFHWDTLEAEEVTVAEASWVPAEAEDDQWAEVPSGRPGVPLLVSEALSEVAEEAGISLILNTGWVIKMYF